MASITSESNGRKTIQFISADHKRRSIRLGKISLNHAEAIKVHVERLVASSITGHALPNDTAAWLTDLSDVLVEKLAAVKLVAPRASMTLTGFLDAHIAVRADVKPATVITFKNVRRNLVDYFGADKPLRDITAGDADEWRLHLMTAEKLSKNTVRRRCGIAKQLFRAALKKKLISENPFSELVAATVENRERDYFVSCDAAKAVLDACPNHEWRLLFALSRYGGLRCPSEHLGLRWSDVNWAGNRITVHSPKTEHHEGKASRQIPIFPELLPYLREAFEKAPDRSEFVIIGYRAQTQNLRTHLTRIIRRAGLDPWPKLWQNLRATRETELAEKWPMHVVCAWIGNSQQIAAKHYLQVTDDHYEQAVSASGSMQNPVQQPVAGARDDSQDEKARIDNPSNCEELRIAADGCEEFLEDQVGVTGLEPVASSV